MSWRQPRLAAQHQRLRAPSCGWQPSPCRVMHARVGRPRTCPANPPELVQSACPHRAAVDGFGGGWGRAQILRIMRDSRVGTYALVGTALLLQIKAAGLAALSGARCACQARARRGMAARVARRMALLVPANAAQGARTQRPAVPHPNRAATRQTATPSPAPRARRASLQTLRAQWSSRTLLRAGRRCRC